MKLTKAEVNQIEKSWKSQPSGMHPEVKQLIDTTRSLRIELQKAQRKIKNLESENEQLQYEHKNMNKLDRATAQTIKKEAIKTLPERQQEVFVFLYEYMGTHDVAPTYREVIANTELRNPGMVKTCLDGLENKGWIVRKEGEARAITLTKKPVEEDESS